MSGDDDHYFAILVEALQALNPQEQDVFMGFLRSGGQPDFVQRVVEATGVSTDLGVAGALVLAYCRPDSAQMRSDAEFALVALELYQPYRTTLVKAGNLLLCANEFDWVRPSGLDGGPYA